MNKYRSNKKYVSISVKTLSGVIVISSLLTLIITVMNVYLDYRDGLKDLDVRFNLIEKGYVSSIAYSLWNFNKKQIQISLDGIQGLPDIVEAKIIEGDDITYSSGKPPEARFRTKEFDVTYVGEDAVAESGEAAPSLLGKLVITASLDRIEGQVFSKALYILIGQALKTFISSCLILLLINFLITRHLKTMKSFFEHYDPKNGESRKLKLRRSARFEGSNVVDDLDYLAESINGVVKNLDTLYKSLEEKVRERTSQLAAKTRDIQIMFQNLQQGIFTITHGLTIHHEYSKYLETILKTSHIAGQDATDVLLADAVMGNDDRSTMQSTIASIVGAPSIAFDLNSHLLPNQIRKMQAGNVQLLELDWQPITSDNSHVEKLLVILRDVTELRKLQQEAESQKREIEVIRQIIGIGPGKVMEFMENTKTSVHEVSELLANATPQSVHIIDGLFRTYHTIKGNARTYELSYLVEALHNAEQEVAALRGQDGGMIDLDRLKDNHRVLEECLTNYQQGLALSAGSGGDSQPAKDDFVTTFDVFSESLHPSPTDGELAATMRQLIDLRRQAHWLTLQTILQDILSSLPSLARDLKKSPPAVRFLGETLLLAKDVRGALADMFTHIFRNCLDHGLESPETRKKLQKEPAGTITLASSVRLESSQIEVWDDGRGLNLAQLERLGKARQLLPAKPDDLAIANVIFGTSLSTAEQVTEISGRGVGLAAVKFDITKLGGSIALEFTGDREPSGYRKFKMIITLPAHLSRPRLS